MLNASRAVLSLAAVSMLTITGCEDDPVDPLATARVEVVSGSAQIGTAGSALSQPVTIRVLSGEGNPLPRVTVYWIVLEGGGSVATDSSVTNELGIATAEWTLGDVAGVQALLARTRTASVRIEARARVLFRDITAGFRHTCGLSTSNRTFCWGLNDRGQLGMNTVSPSEAATAVGGGVEFRTISAGWFHTCGLTDGGQVYCWGDNTVGQLGSPGPTAAVPRRVTGLNETISWISAGYQHTCAAATSGAVYCWGVDDFGQLGIGGATPACFNPAVQRCMTTPQRVNTTVNLGRVAAGEFHTCAIASDGAVHCWGWNANGQIGNLGAGGAIFNTPVRTLSNRTYALVDAGSRHNCAITQAERLECWGRNFFGEIGVTAGIALSAPNPLSTTQLFRDIDVAETHSCAVSTDARAFCWGSLLGNGTANTSVTPVEVSLTAAVTAISAGGDHACAVVDGDVWCWGSNSNRQLGVAGIARSNTPVRVEVGQ